MKNLISWFTVHTLVSNFVYSCQINWECWKLLYIEGSFSWGPGVKSRNCTGHSEIICVIAQKTGIFKAIVHRVIDEAVGHTSWHRLPDRVNLYAKGHCLMPTVSANHSALLLQYTVDWHHVLSGPKKRYPGFNFATTSVSVHRFSQFFHC